MLLPLIAYFIFLILPCDAQTPTRTVINVATHAKFAKNPTPAYHIPYSVCSDLVQGPGKPKTGNEVYRKLRPNVWLAGWKVKENKSPSSCGQCLQAMDALNPIDVWFYIVDRNCTVLETAAGALDSIQGSIKFDFDASKGLQHVGIENCLISATTCTLS
ncbi:hypothetical protein TWF718_001737 [Orbilia javanica]|uniref:Uncharacterized protein n=1 Tax=Orbilia javanica TaxID=47235 RepID=A0AAN8NA49_9PEZI